MSKMTTKEVTKAANDTKVGSSNEEVAKKIKTKSKPKRTSVIEGMSILNRYKSSNKAKDKVKDKESIAPSLGVEITSIGDKMTIMSEPKEEASKKAKEPTSKEPPTNVQKSI